MMYFRIKSSIQLSAVSFLAALVSYDIFAVCAKYRRKPTFGAKRLKTSNRGAMIDLR